MGRVLGIDHGKKRIGLSLSDPEQNLAFPHKVIENDWENVKKTIRNLISDQNISEIVIGLPLGFRNQDTLQTEEVRVFSENVRREFGLPVTFENEIFSTRQVLKTGASPRKKRDASSAALILQGYLDRVKNINR